MLSRGWARTLYITTYIALIVGIGLSLLITGYDLIRQTLELAQGGGRYFYIFIIVGCYVATVHLLSNKLIKGRARWPHRPYSSINGPQGPFSHSKTIHAHQESRCSKRSPTLSPN